MMGQGPLETWWEMRGPDLHSFLVGNKALQTFLDTLVSFLTSALDREAGDSVSPQAGLLL